MLAPISEAELEDPRLLALGLDPGDDPQPDEDDERDEALREAEARFTALAESAPIGIFLSEIGLRLGYVIAPPALIRPMQKLQQNFFISANSMVQRAAMCRRR